MKSFAEALCSNEKNDRIPETYDYFGGLIGEWAIEWNDRLNDTVPRRVKGEWIFSRVLEGIAVQERAGYRYQLYRRSKRREDYQRTSV